MLGHGAASSQSEVHDGHWCKLAHHLRVLQMVELFLCRLICFCLQRVKAECRMTCIAQPSCLTH